MPTTPNFSQPAIFSEVATPTVPDSGYLKVYAKSGTLYSIANGGSEKSYVAISGSGLPIGAYTLPTTDGTASQVLQTNGSGTVTWQTVSGGGGGGITSINGDTTAAQLLTVGTAGTDFAIDSVTTAGTSVFNIPDASATARGLITTGTQTIAGTKTLAGDLLFTDATYDIGKSGATRPRDGFFSRNLTVEATANINLITLGSVAQGFVGLSVGTSTLNLQANTTVWGTLSVGTGWGSVSASNGGGVVIGVTDSTGTVHQRSGTTAQTFRLYETYTSSTSFGALQIKANAGAAYQIGSAIGSAGGTNRDLNFGIWDTAGTFASSFYVGSTYAGVNDSKIFYVGTSSRIEFSALSSLASPAIRFAWGGGSPACVYGGSNTLGVGINGFTRLLFGVSSTDFTGSPFTISNTAVATGAYTGFSFTGAAHTNQTASTEATMVNWNLAQTVQFATGALTTQRAMRIQAPTYGFVGASTITTASTLSISGAPVAGTNATITNAYALNVESGRANFAGSISTPSLVVPYPVLEITSYNGALARFCVGTANNLILSHSMEFGFYSAAISAGGTIDTTLQRDSAGVLAMRSSGLPTTANAFRVYTTYTSSTSNEFLQIRGVASANFEIGPQNGSAGGTLRGLTLGGYSAGSTTITPWLTFDNVGTATLTKTMSASGQTLLQVSPGNLSSSTNYLSLISNGVDATDFLPVFFARGTGANSGLGFVMDTAGSWSSGTVPAIDFQVRNAGATQTSTNRPAFAFRNFSTNLLVLSVRGDAVLTPMASTSGSPTALTLTGAAHTTLALSTEAPDVNFNLARTVQFATGALTTQRAMRIQAPTYSFVGASTITTASTVSISGPPVAGTNATITTPYALNVESGNVNVAGNVLATTLIASGYIQITSGGSNALLAGWTSDIRIKSTWGFSWASSSEVTNGVDLTLLRDAAGILAQRNGTNAQTYRVYNTYTSSTSYETLNLKGKASANFEIGPENGSAGGTLRGLTIGGYSAGSTTITPWLSFTSSGVPTFDQGTVVIPSGGTGLMCQQTNVYLDSYGTHSGIRYRRSEGTQGSPTGVAFNSLLGFVATYGYHTGSAYHSTKGASIDFYATEAFTSGAQGTKIVFGTTPNGTTTNTVALTIDQNQVATFSKLVAQSAAEITSTPSGTTQTITLNNGNHQTLTLTSSTGAVTATLTVPSNVSSGTIIVKQHGTTPRNITWAVSAGTIKWMGTQPTWSSDAANDIRIVSWRYDGSVMYLMSTDKAA